MLGINICGEFNKETLDTGSTEIGRRRYGLGWRKDYAVVIRVEIYERDDWRWNTRDAIIKK